MAFKSDRALKKQYLKECGQWVERPPVKKKKKPTVKVVTKKKFVKSKTTVKRKPKIVNSKGEERIAVLLKDLGISFEREKIFKSCINPLTGMSLRFDFYIPSHKMLIEYDGIHHTKQLKFVSLETFEAQKARDVVKNEWCLLNGYNLIRIPSSQYRRLKLIIEKLFGNVIKII